MSMSNYNRQNPFMYLMESKQDELYQKSIIVIKYLIINLIIGILTLIINFSLTLIVFDIESLVMFVISTQLNYFIIFLILKSFIEVKKCTKSLNLQEINTMIFGDEYKDININNEKILAMINEFNVSIGKIDAINESIKINNLIFIFYIGLYLIIGMSLLFN